MRVSTVVFTQLASHSWRDRARQGSRSWARSARRAHHGARLGNPSPRRQQGAVRDRSSTRTSWASSPRRRFASRKGRTRPAQRRIFFGPYPQRGLVAAHLVGQREQGADAGVDLAQRGKGAHLCLGRHQRKQLLARQRLQPRHTTIVYNGQIFIKSTGAHGPECYAGTASTNGNIGVGITLVIRSPTPSSNTPSSSSERAQPPPIASRIRS
jgi:hypothetical protein